MGFLWDTHSLTYNSLSVLQTSGRSTLHPDTTSDEIYADVVADLVLFVQQGGVGTLFAYGQTGSGKTFTISQLLRLVARSLLDDAYPEQPDIFITIFELARNSAFDLLDSRKALSVLEDTHGNMQLAGATERRVSSSEDMISLVDQSASYRRTASTFKNDTSSRSHSICRIRVTLPDAREGVFYLVDLAGSEASRDVAQHGADRMRETREINMSLSVLKDCMRGKAELEALQKKGARSRQKKVRVPIRQSTLTKVLKHIFDPESTRACKTVVIACVNPSLADVGPTKNTLRYAEMLRAPISTVET